MSYIMLFDTCRPILNHGILDQKKFIESKWHFFYSSRFYWVNKKLFGIICVVNCWENFENLCVMLFDEHVVQFKTASILDQKSSSSQSGFFLYSTPLSIKKIVWGSFVLGELFLRKFWKSPMCDVIWWTCRPIWNRWYQIRKVHRVEMAFYIQQILLSK
jgi:hypothetical protein